MTITYHAGRRIQGLDSDRTATQLPSGSVGGWKLLDREQLTGAGNNITVSGLTDKRYLMFLSHGIASSSNPVMAIQYNNDSSGTNGVNGNYSARLTTNGSSGSTFTYQTQAGLSGGGLDTGAGLTVGYIANKSDKEKLSLGHFCNGATIGSGVAPDIGFFTGKWANTSNSISTINIKNNNTGSFAVNSELVVLAYDPSDTSTSNFWQELTTKTSTSESNTVTTDVVTPKKYNWVQVFIPYSTGSADNFDFRVGTNSISTSGYCQRYDIDGGAGGAGTQINQPYIRMAFNISSGSEWLFANIFFINNSSNEKLFISNAVRSESASQPPHRYETGGKWITSGQVNIFQILHQNGASNLGTGSIIKWWGAD